MSSFLTACAPETQQLGAPETTHSKRAQTQEGELGKQVIAAQKTSTGCEPLITADRAAELLKLHPKTVKRLAQAGKLPGMKIGRVWRFRESSLDAWASPQLQWSGHPSPKGDNLL